MKRKNDKLKKPNIKQVGASFDQVQGQNKVQSEHHDEAYRQINIVSFNKNFKALLGHYKSEDSSSR